MKVCSFPLMGRNRRIKAKTIGPPHGLPKRLTFRSGSAFQGMQTQAPLRESQTFSPSLGQPPLRVLAVAPAPSPVEGRRSQEGYDEERLGGKSSDSISKSLA